MNDSHYGRPVRSRLVLGLFLLALGAALFAINLGYDLPDGWWRHAPWVLVALGLLGVVWPNQHLSRSGGVWLLATGLYALFGLFNWWGLGFASAWPVFVIAAGAAVLLPAGNDFGRG